MSYITKKLEFTDFTTESKFYVLKVWYRYKSQEQPSIQELERLEAETDFKIKLDDIDDHGYVVGEAHRSFIEDFLYPNIPKMAAHFFKKHQGVMDEKSIYHPESIESYSKHVLNECHKWFSDLEESKHLDQEIKKKVLQQLERYIQDIQYHVKYPFAYVEPKLKFNWNKADVLYFFHLLRENKQIEYLSNASFAQIIDNLVEYKDGESYAPINDSRKRLSAYNQQTPPIVSESKKRLLLTFSKSDFYKE